MHGRKVFLIGGLHFIVDLYAGFFAIYMVLAELDPARSALIIAVASFVANAIQPVMGYWSDRIRGKLPVFLSVITAAVFMSSIGLTRSYLSLFGLMLIGLSAVSLFHPAGANISVAAGLHRKERSFSLFVTIGTVGFALSQPVFSAFTDVAGNTASVLLAVPGVALALAYLLFSRTGVSGPERKLDLSAMADLLRRRFATLLLLFLITVFRHGFIMSLAIFIAKIFADWGFSRFSYSTAHAVYTVGGAVGILAAGAVAHRVRAKTMLHVSLLGFLLPFGLLMYSGQSSMLALSFLFLAITGVFLQFSHITVVIMGHRIFPEGTATISGILMGFGWAVGRLSYPLVPLFQDAVPGVPGLSSGLIILALFPLAASALTLLLPSETEAPAAGFDSAAKPTAEPEESGSRGTY